ncbi:MAG: class I SAM-dependent methyltransferase [Gammaproteobacteria bacterium]
MAVHRSLERVVRRHAEHLWRQPLHPPTVAAFENLQRLLEPAERERVVLDSGCGTASGTAALAERHPGRIVIGVDRSAHRLRRAGDRCWPVREGAMIRVRAELGTFWRLAHAAGWRLAHHYLLYPNPWPKPAQLRRRWHGHPAFPVLLGLGGRLCLRCNWEIYAREFARAVFLLSGRAPTVERLAAPEGLTPFERKYAASGHGIWEVRVALEAQGARAATLS